MLPLCPCLLCAALRAAAAACSTALRCLSAAAHCRETAGMRMTLMAPQTDPPFWGPEDGRKMATSSSIPDLRIHPSKLSASVFPESVVHAVALAIVATRPRGDDVWRGVGDRTVLGAALQSSRAGHGRRRSEI
eukprot:793085-Pleurochrysis_carterae.AAC.3